MTLTTSTLTANSALTGGAVDNADNSGLAQLVVSATTVSGNSGTAPGIENGNGTGTVATAADLLADACDQGTGWTDAGYDVGDATCLAGGPGSVTSSTVPSYLGALANNGGPTRTMLPLTGNAGIGAIPATKSVTLAGKSATLCPTTDQRGVASVAGRTCSAGAVQVAAPVITTASQATFVLSTPGTFTVRATGLPAPQFSEVGTLPTGVTLSADGLLSGTPTRSGSFPITVTAHNSSGADAHQAFTLTVDAVQLQGYWLVGGDGATHQGSYDLSFMRCIPNMVIMAPSNEDECRQMLYTATTLESPAAVRYPRGTGRGVAIQEEMRALPVGKGVLVREGRSGLALLAFGSLVASAEAIGERLDATVVNMRFVKPLDSELVDRIAGKNQYIITLEENAIAGGAGSAVGELLASLGHRSALLHIGIPDRAIMHGTRENCLAEADLDSASLQRQIDAWWQPRLLRLAEIG